MALRERFDHWVIDEIGSAAVPAVVNHLRDRDYRLYCLVEDGDSWHRSAYHPRHGFFQAGGNTDREALLGILRQTWMVESLTSGRAPLS